MAKSETRSKRSSKAGRKPKRTTDRPEEVAGYTYDQRKADRVVNFLQRFVTMTSGRQWAGRPMELMDWQKKDVIEPLFGWVDAGGLRRYRRAAIYVPKKNGKSSLMAGLVLYFLLADGEPGACVYGAAVDRIQAGLIYRSVAASVRASPELSRVLEVIDSRSTIVHRASGSRYTCLAADSWRAEGIDASAVVIDELHAHRKPDLVEALIYAGAARSQPLVVAISTAGSDRNGIGYQWWQDAELVEKDPAANPTFYGKIYRADPDKDDLSDPKTWRKANPSLGVTISEADFAADWQDAQTNPRKRSTFDRYRLNIWREPDGRFFDPDAFAACQLPPPEPLAGRPVAVGVDLASNIDMTAVAFVAKSPDGSYDVDMRYFVPEETVADAERKSRIPYSTWIREGWVIPTPGARLDHERVAQEILRYGEHHKLLDVGVDPWQVGLLATLLERAGVTVKAIRQATASLNAPMKLMEGLVAERKLRYTSPVLLYNANNLCVYQDPTGLVKPDKAKSREKIDGCVALVNALAVAMTADEQMAAPGENDWDIVQL